MKDLASLTKQDIQKLIDCHLLSGWRDDRIHFPCPYSNDNLHYMVSFDTSKEQSIAYDIIFNKQDCIRSYFDRISPSANQKESQLTCAEMQGERRNF